jgi:hypothetical protein
VALIPGNLLSYNHQSVETSIGNWADFANGASSVVQGSGTFLEGSKSILTTRNATAGDVAMGGLTTTGNAPVVSPGTTYVYSFWVFSTVANTVWHAQNDWYQSNNTTFISTVTGPDTTVPASTWTEIKSTQTAPALAGVARLFLQLRSGLSSTQTANIDQVFFGLPVAADFDRLFLPGRDPVALAPWGGVDDWQHDVIVDAGTASITFVIPTRSAFLLLALAGETGLNPAVTADDPYAVSPLLLTPDDVTGGMQPWAGAPDSITTVATTANAGVAAISFVAQGPSAGLESLPATSSITLTANAPQAAVGGLPGTASVTFTARDSSVGIAVLPGAAVVSLTAQIPTAGIATTAGVSSVTFTGRDATSGLGALPGTASVTTSVQQETTGLGIFPSAAPVILAGLAPSVIVIEGTADPSVPLFLPDDPYGGMIPWAGAPEGYVTNDATVVAGVASMIVTAQSPTAALGALPGTATVIQSAQSASAGLSVLPATSSITLTARGSLAAVGALPGTASVSVSARGPAVGLAMLPNAAPVSFTAQQASVPGATVANAGVAAILMSAPGPVAGAGALAGTAAVTISGRSSLTGISALPATAIVAVAALGASVVLPQTGTPTVISGREPIGQVYGREPTVSASGQETGPISGRQPLSSTSGTESDSAISGREP